MEYIERELFALSKIEQISYSHIRTIMEDMMYTEHSELVYNPESELEKKIYMRILLMNNRGYDNNLILMVLNKLCEEEKMLERKK